MAQRYGFDPNAEMPDNARLAKQRELSEEYLAAKAEEMADQLRAGIESAEVSKWRKFLAKIRRALEKFLPREKLNELDDRTLTDLLRKSLANAGYQIDVDGKSALQSRRFDKVKSDRSDNSDESDAERGGAFAKDGRASIAEFEDGLLFVDVKVDQHLFDGLDRDQAGALAQKIIKDRFSGTVIGKKNFAFVNKTAGNWYRYPSTHIDDDVVYKAKMRASTELDNLLDAGKPKPDKKDGEAGHVHPNVDSFSYFETVFKVGDRFYQGLVNIMNNNKGKLFKDVTKIKDITEAISNSYGKNPKFTYLNDVSDTNINASGDLSSDDLKNGTLAVKKMERKSDRSDNSDESDAERGGAFAKEGRGSAAYYRNWKDILGQFKEELKNVSLNQEQQDIFDVVVGDKKSAEIRINDIENLERVFLEKGSRKKGARKIVFIHYNGKRNPVSAFEIVNMGEVIRRGVLTEEGNAEHPMSRRYELKTDDGTTLKIIFDLNRKKDRTVINFYSDRKSESGGNNTGLKSGVITVPDTNINASDDLSREDLKKSGRGSVSGLFEIHPITTEDGEVLSAKSVRELIDILVASEGTTYQDIISLLQGNNAQAFFENEGIILDQKTASMIAKMALQGLYKENRKDKEPIQNVELASQLDPALEDNMIEALLAVVKSANGDLAALLEGGALKYLTDNGFPDVGNNVARYLVMEARDRLNEIKRKQSRKQAFDNFRQMDPLFDFIAEFAGNGENILINPGEKYVDSDVSGSFISPTWKKYAVKRPQGAKESDASYRKYLAKREMALGAVEGTNLDEIARAYVQEYGGDEVEQKMFDLLGRCLYIQKGAAKHLQIGKDFLSRPRCISPLVSPRRGDESPRIADDGGHNSG